MWRRETSGETVPAHTLISDFKPSGLGENKFLLFKHPVYRTLVWWSYRTNKPWMFLLLPVGQYLSTWRASKKSQHSSRSMKISQVPCKSVLGTSHRLRWYYQIVFPHEQEHRDMSDGVAALPAIFGVRGGKSVSRNSYKLVPEFLGILTLALGICFGKYVQTLHPILWCHGCINPWRR